MPISTSVCNFCVSLKIGFKYQFSFSGIVYRTLLFKIHTCFLCVYQVFTWEWNLYHCQWPSRTHRLPLVSDIPDALCEALATEKMTCGGSRWRQTRSSDASVSLSMSQGRLANPNCLPIATDKFDQIALNERKRLRYFPTSHSTFSHVGNLRCQRAES